MGKRGDLLFSVSVRFSIAVLTKFSDYLSYLKRCKDIFKLFDFWRVLLQNQGFALKPPQLLQKRGQLCTQVLSKSGGQYDSDQQRIYSHQVKRKRVRRWKIFR